jgi:hypothetical protein
MRQSGRKAGKLALRGTDKKSPVVGGAKRNSSKLSQRRVNVYENKEPLWKARGQSWNVYENKGV